MLRLSGVKVKLNTNFIFKVSSTTLLSNKLLLVGRRLLRYFPSVGKFYETVKRYNLSKDTYTLKFSDDSWEEITFDDAGDILWSFKSKYSWYQFLRTDGLELHVDDSGSGVLDESRET
jgi:hypothetical protein